MSNPGDSESTQPSGLREGSRWPIGGGHFYFQTGLAEHLWSSGRDHARRALSTFGSPEDEDQQLAAISVGCAVELVSKALIARIAPALLSERGDRDTLLHLSDHGHRASSGATSVRTLSAAEAVATATHLHPSLTWRQPRDSVVFRVRNAAAHMALVDTVELHAAVLDMLRYIHSILTATTRDPILFWDTDLAPLASDLLDEALSERRRAVAAKRAAAQGHLASLVGRLDPSARAAVLASLSGRQLSYADHEEPQPCPVCEQQGWLICGVERGEVQWDPEGGPYVTQTAWPFAFECAVCGLSLEGDELNEFDFPDEIELAPDTDPAEIHAAWEDHDDDMRRGR